MSDESTPKNSAEDRQKRERSPNYPAIGLGHALKLARKIWDSEKRSPMRADLAMKHMGFGGASGPARTYLAALKKYGLVVDEGGQRVRLSEDAVRVLQYTEDNPERQKLLRDMALRPEIFREILKYYNDDLPIYANLRGHLIADRGFTEFGVTPFIKALRETVEVAKLDAGQYSDEEMAPQDPVNEHANVQAAQVRPQAFDVFGGEPSKFPSPVKQAPQETGHPVPPPMVWPLGKGVFAELRANKLLEPEHYDMLMKYLEIAKMAATEE